MPRYLTNEEILVEWVPDASTQSIFKKVDPFPSQPNDQSASNSISILLKSSNVMNTLL